MSCMSARACVCERENMNRLTRASGDISRGIASAWECDCNANIYLEAKCGIIPILDQNTETLDTLGRDLLVPRAAVRRGRFRLPSDKGQARRQPDELVGAFGTVGRQVGAPQANQTAQQCHKHKKQVMSHLQTVCEKLAVDAELELKLNK